MNQPAAVPIASVLVMRVPALAPAFHVLVHVQVEEEDKNEFLKKNPRFLMDGMLTVEQTSTQDYRYSCELNVTEKA